MRILFAIPHYFAWTTAGNYASERSTPEARAQTVRQCVASLLQTFSGAQGLMNGRTRQFHPANPRLSAEVTIALCTTGENHLVPQLGLDCFDHIRTHAEPRFLGFECHKVLRNGLGQYDYFGYLEDDLRIVDGLFLAKLGWFGSQFGDAAVLQPNRFELIDDPLPYKLYIDGNMHDGRVSPSLQRIEEHRRIEVPAFGQSVVFQRIDNPHSGCFFLNPAQLERWVQQREFAVPLSVFGGPLESAATLGIMRHFRVYKPARENAAFLEIEHLDRRYLGRHFWPAAGNPPYLVWDA
ncbi:MAG TPA: hypothetical protein VHY35_09230 [Stellaceae bacterium]|jgi:hypothetical protein|nr:hypothetical protein [Stellaceae bacterium]